MSVDIFGRPTGGADCVHPGVGRDGRCLYCRVAIPKYRDMAGYCEWVFKSGWATGMTCTSTAWWDVDGEARCTAHKKARR